LRAGSLRSVIVLAVRHLGLLRGQGGNGWRGEERITDGGSHAANTVGSAKGFPPSGPRFRSRLAKDARAELAERAVKARRNYSLDASA